MSVNEVIPLSQYYKPEEPITWDIEELSDCNLSAVRDRQRVNDLVMNIVLKYTAHYLELDPNDVRKIQEEIRNRLIVTKESIQTAINQAIENVFGEKNPIENKDKMAFLSLSDTQTTAALFKEITFETGFQYAPTFSRGRRFSSLDLGSGAGILVLASYVAGKRAEARSLICQGIEIQPIAAERSRRALKKVISENRFKIIEGDAGSTELIKRIGDIPQIWTSETISHETPPLKVFADHAEIDAEGDKRTEWEMGMIVNRNSDPFPYALNATLRAYPRFYEAVKQGETRMIPDIINGKYKPGEATLKLATGRNPRSPLMLHNVGEEFKAYETMYESDRWVDPASRLSAEELMKLYDL